MKPTGTRTAADLDVYEAAYLAGGPDRVIDTALVALVQTGRVRVHSPGQLATVDLTRRHPVEAAVLDAVGPTGHRSVDTIRWRLTDDARILDVGRALQRDGLISRSPLRRPGSRPSGADRRILGDLRAQRTSASDEWSVALDGRESMLDRELRASIFEPPRTDREVSKRRSAVACARSPACARASTDLTSRLPSASPGALAPAVSPSTATPSEAASARRQRRPEHVARLVPRQRHVPDEVMGAGVALHLVVTVEEEDPRLVLQVDDVRARSHR